MIVCNGTAFRPLAPYKIKLLFFYVCYACKRKVRIIIRFLHLWTCKVMFEKEAGASETLTQCSLFTITALEHRQKILQTITMKIVRKYYRLST